MSGSASIRARMRSISATEFSAVDEVGHSAASRIGMGRAAADPVVELVVAIIPSRRRSHVLSDFRARRRLWLPTFT